MTKSVVARTFLHSAYVRDTGKHGDAVVVSEIVEYDDGSTEPALRIAKNPNTVFWVTQPAYRDHPDKKEFEDLKFLDEYIVPNKDKDKEIFHALKGYVPNYITPKQRRELYQSPHVYGANIDIEALVAMKYNGELEKHKKIPQKPTTGFFDIERSLLPSSLGKLPLMAYVYENQVYLAMMDAFMYSEINGVKQRVDISHIREAAHKHIDPLVESIFEENKKDLGGYKHKVPFQYHFFVGKDEVEMITWIFGEMHKTKPSFIGIWNLGFDIPEIIKVLEENNIPLPDIFCDPSLRGTGYAFTRFKEDKRKVHHFTQKWHWLTNTAHFQFIDSMALYSYIRQVDGKENSYALDDILKKFNLGGKLKIDSVDELKDLQTADWHRAMLSRFFVEYAVYTMWDAIGLQLLEWRNNDLTSMMLLAASTPIRFFPNQTIRVTNTLYADWKPEKQILGTGIDVEGIRDDDLLTEGGAVLEPGNLTAKGMCLFEEWPSHSTRVYAWCDDVDFSALYPTIDYVANISKQTLKATMVAIRGEHVNKHYKADEAVEVFCSYLITPDANAVEMGTEFFGLPGYDEIDQLFTEHLKTI